MSFPLSISDTFDAAWDLAIKHGGGVQARVAWARGPKKPASARVMRHFMKHQRQLQSAKNSGLGPRETDRRHAQIKRGIINVS